MLAMGCWALLAPAGCAEGGGGGEGDRCDPALSHNFLLLCFATIPERPHSPERSTTVPWCYARSKLSERMNDRRFSERSPLILCILLGTAQAWISRYATMLKNIIEAQSNWNLNTALSQLARGMPGSWLDSFQNGTISIKRHNFRPIEINDARVVQMKQDPTGVVFVGYPNTPPYRYQISARKAGTVGLIALPV